VCEVLVHGPRLGLGRADWDAGGRGIVEEVVAALEAVVEDWVSPWREDDDGGLKGVEGEFEADLIIALAGAAVRDGEAA
jgi:hypothetical protein